MTTATSSRSKMAPPRFLWKLSVVVTPEVEDPISALLQELTGEPVTVEVDWDTRRTTASVFLRKKTDWSASRKRAFQSSLLQFRKDGLEVGQGRISLRRLRRENWAESWKRHFKPIEIERALLIKPSWIHRPAKPGQAVVVLDPGLSFGTGHHATTSYCLRQLVRQVAPVGLVGRSVSPHPCPLPPSFLDVGCGSGILAIAAVKLGYRPVHAFDFDPEAVRVARENARQNGVRFALSRKDLTRLPPVPKRQYSVVCANLTADLLIAQKGKITAWVSPSGVLVLAGILVSQFPEVQQAYALAGWEMKDQATEGEWCSGTFVES